MSGYRVLITGVAGFLGSHLADAFLDEGWEVYGIDNLIGGYEENIPKGVIWENVDLKELDAIQHMFEGVDLVVHAACTAYEGLSVFSPSLVVGNTVQATVNVMSASVKAGIKKVVYMSSMARYGTQPILPFTESMPTNPQDPYGIAKVASENLVRNVAETHGLEYVILVPHNIIGPRQKYDDPYRNVASIMINRILQGKPPIIYGDGEQVRCFSFIDDVTIPIMNACLSRIANGRTINIGPDEEFITVNELAEMLLIFLDSDLEPVYMAGRPQEVRHATCDATLARELLDYETTVPLDEGLQMLIEWIKVKGVKPFNYHLPLEFVTDKTPRTWTDHLI
jgi:UDP-glucose 4-epimerase